MDESELRQFAIIGARQKIEQLQDQIDQIVALFPELGKSRRKSRGGDATVLFDATHAPKSARRASGNGLGGSPTFEANTRPVLEAIADGCISANDISARTGVPMNPLLQRLYQMHHRGAIERLAERGHYAITKVGRQALDRGAWATGSRGKYYRPSEAKKPSRKNGAPSRKVSNGGPSRFSPEMREAIIKRLKDGEMASALGQEIGAPPSTVRGWMTATKKASK